MRALTGLVVLALAAPMPAFACGMMMRKDTVNLAEVMKKVEGAPVVAATAEVKADAPIEAPAKVEPKTDDASVDAADAPPTKGPQS